MRQTRRATRLDNNYETQKITRKASNAADIELFGSSARDRHARRI